MEKPLIFSVELHEEIGEELYALLLRGASPSRREYVARFRQKRDKDRALVAHILAKYALHEAFGITNPTFAAGAFGKPYVEGDTGAFFNVSHSKNMVVCAVFDKEIGIDVEATQPINHEPLANRAFSKSELERYYACPQQSREREFYSIWVAKESYLKYLGTGLCDIKKAPSQCKITHIPLKTPGYICACCTK